MGRRVALVVEVTYRVYSVPEREATVRILRAEVPGLEVWEDDARNGLWWNARRTWSAPCSTSHLLVMQDDILLCKNFTTIVDHLANLYPDSIISLYSNRKAGREAFTSGSRWFRLRDLTFGQALLMPVASVQPWLDWEAEFIDPACPHDDARLGMYASHNDIDIHCTVPSLVQHSGAARSTVGHSDPRRRSPYFIGRILNPMDFDWTRGWPGRMATRPASIYESMWASEARPA